jgi:hypothetical protein
MTAGETPTHRWLDAAARAFPTVALLRRYFAARADPLTQLFLVLPLFITYHVGVIAQVERTPQGRYVWVGNGVDFLTATALELAHGDVFVYAAGAVAVTLILLALILRARRGSALHPRLFLPLLAESATWALLAAGAIGYAVDLVGLGVLDADSLFTQVVSSCGAGLHEELVFRMGLFHGAGYLLERRVAVPWRAWLAVGAVTSALFAGMHYLGPYGDRFSVSSFAFRLFLGAAFATIYRLRGFAVAAWTHALYDILYFALRRL